MLETGRNDVDLLKYVVK
jgi:hypothetical protein